LTSTSSGWLRANATMRAKLSAGMAELHPVSLDSHLSDRRPA
jgi:hypothetical protein